MNHDDPNLEDQLRGLLERKAARLGSMLDVPESAVRRARRRIARTAVVAVVALGIAGYGAAAGIGALGTPHHPIPGNTGPSSARHLKIGLIADHQDLRRLAPGLREAKREGIPVTVRQSEDAVSGQANLNWFGTHGYDVVVNFHVAAFSQVFGTTYPGTRFVDVDDWGDYAPASPDNFVRVFLRAQEASYLAGYLAALVVERQGGPQVVSAIAGTAFWQWGADVAGYEAGARAANPSVRVLVARSGTSDASRCADLARGQISQGSQVVFPVGDCSIGALAAAGQAGVWGIGEDTDQASLGPFILTSVVKHEDEALLRTLEAITGGGAEGGRLWLGLADGVVGLGQISPDVPADIVSQVENVQSEIESGQITHIPVH